MSRTLQPTPKPDAQVVAEDIVWPEFAPSPGYRHFIERLRRARIECGLSLSDMAKRVGLGFQLAHEFENLITPLPFCHLSLWSEAVGVPFDDFVAIYNAEMEELFDAQERETQERETQERETQEREAQEREAQEREAQEREAEQREAEQRETEQNAPCITNTKAPTLAPTEAPAPALSRSDRGGGFSNLLRSAFAHISKRFRSRFSTPTETPK